LERGAERGILKDIFVMMLSSKIEALLFAAGEPMPKKKLASLLGVSAEEIEAGIKTLHGKLSGGGLAIIETPNEAEMRTSPQVAETVKKLREAELSRDLGKAGLETLATILYRGGATRSEIDWIRGVNSAGTVRSLLLRGLIEKSEDVADKRRFRYIATTDALAHLGVGSVSELPRYNELKLEVDAAAKEAEEAEARK
jgi:segregation and condensation protein B